MALRKVEMQTNSQSFKFEKPGQKLAGHWIRSEEKMINGSEAMEHLFSTANGLVHVLGQYQITQFLSKKTEGPGTYVVITFLKTTKLKGGKTVKEYSFAIDDELFEANVDSLVGSTGGDASEPESEEFNEESLEVSDDSVEDDVVEENLAPPPARRPAPPAARPAATRSAAVSPERAAAAAKLLGKKN